jgi:small conductance mechanosensitive channel
MPDWLPDNLAALVVFKPIRIVLLIIAAFVLRRVLHRMINRSVRRAVDRPLTSRNQMAQKLIDATTVSAERRKQRIESLGSLASSAVSFVIFLVAILMILAEMGFNITTLVAGTSVVAVTLAFGMQSIVKDLVSGVFMLVEDQLGVGDYVGHGEGVRGRRGHRPTRNGAAGQGRHSVVRPQWRDRPSRQLQPGRPG